jgi:DNA-binding CsgD family transcriptional regulator
MVQTVDVADKTPIMPVLPFPRPDCTPRASPAELPSDPRLLRTAAEALAKGLIVFDAAGRILDWNDAARGALLQRPGLTCVPAADGPPGSLRLSSPAGALQARIETAVRDCAIRRPGTGGSHGVVLNLGGAPGFRPMLLRLAATLSEDGEPLVVGILVDPQKPARRDGALLADLFDISPAAARVAESYLKVDTVKDVARLLQISVNTVKSHLATVYVATGCTRQSQLVRLLMTLNNSRVP